MPVQEDTNAAEHCAHLTPPRRGAHNGQSHSPATMKLLRRLGLTYIATDELTIRRLRHGRGFRYVAGDGTPLRGEESQRLAALAVPPAYVDVLFATDPSAHIQAIGRDAAGRLQYRYHPDWQRVREMRKARRLARLAEVLPQIRRSIARHLGATEPTRAFTLAAVIDLVARSAIRPGSEQYARLRGTRGAATLLKSNISVYGETVRLCFRAKGGKRVEKEAGNCPAAASFNIAAKTACCARRARTTSTASCAKSQASKFRSRISAHCSLLSRCSTRSPAPRRRPANAPGGGRCSTPFAKLPTILAIRRRSAPRATCTKRL